MYRAVATLVFFLSALLLGFNEASLDGAGSRSILRAVGGRVGDGSVEYGVELNASNFDAELKDTPASFAIVEFFANWLVKSSLVIANGDDLWVFMIFWPDIIRTYITCDWFLRKWVPFRRMFCSF